jgi:RimJ/RimL family protein N-acetyltransferase
MFPLTTPRLTIRPLTRDDLRPVAEVLDRCFDPRPLDAHADWLEWTVRSVAELRRLHQPPYGDYAIERRSDGRLIGLVGLVPCLGPFDRLFRTSAATEAPPEPDCHHPEVGLYWCVHPEQRRQGFAAEAARAMADFAFASLHLHRLIATTDRANAPSRAVMRRLGMREFDNACNVPPWLQIVGKLDHPGGRCVATNG